MLLYLAILPAYKVEQIINETGPTAKIWIK
ncbi:MAG: hypothetical protein ACJASU_001976 [Cognaticolwellia sp.]|jgi:hypothetical protein